MGKKYIPIQISIYQYRAYLTDLNKIYKIARKTLPAVPPYSRGVVRKESLETVPDELNYLQLNEAELWGEKQMN